MLEQIELKMSALGLIVRHYTRETGVRNLEREITSICRKQARRFLEGRTGLLNVNREVVAEFLGSTKFRLEEEVAERAKRRRGGGRSGVDSRRRRHPVC